MRRLLFLAVLLLLTREAGLGCSLRGMQLQQVSPDLTIVVTHREKPIANIQVEIRMVSSTEPPIFTATTDEHGTVLIQGIPLGEYYLTAAHGEFEAGKEWIEVVAAPGAKTKTRFDFEWADWSYQTSRVAGKLSGLIPGNTGNKLKDLIYPQPTVYPGVAITLRGAFSDVEYRTFSDSTGSFVIDHVPDGIYILAIAGGMKSVQGVAADATVHVIDVTHTATRDSLPLQLKDTGCYRTEFQLDEK